MAIDVGQTRNNPVTMQAIVAYVVTFVLVFFSLTQLPNLLTSILFGKLVGPSFAQFVGALISWTIISALWQRILGETIPILVLVGSIGWILCHLKFEFGRLSPAAKSSMFTEIWAIAVIGIWRITDAKAIHWF